MTKEEAIAIIRKEYLCVDRDCDIERSCGRCDLMMPSKEPILEAYNMAIKALEQEPVVLEQEPCIEPLERLAESASKTAKVLERLDVLDEIRVEIDRQRKWLLQAGYTAYNLDIAFNSIKSVIERGRNDI